ncbi:HAD family hydrolase [Shimazuella sp. AN120528]|uniref:Cof-type HAD-IIB family hydrolase n=1 Tax=Shimazuella soli TaxID=1892854 RepID=UPI001F0E28E9|nr:Cof-type HAD-IIB family hydrolase [Shimazuella soli]MCH5585740.1 HAD family hydrolase [Shimazuella soli]
MYPIYPLLVADLDGTLLNSANQIPHIVKKRINDFRRNGGRFSIATGRSLAECKIYLEELQVEEPVIIYNGAAIYLPLEDRIIPLYTLSMNLMETLLQDIRKLPITADILLHSPTSMYVRRMRISTREALEQLPIRIRLFPPGLKLLEPIFKIQLIGTSEEIDRLKEWAQTYPLSNYVEFTQTEDEYFEILPIHASKGRALLKVLQLINFSMDQTAVIGDHCNDISMFQIASLAATVRNAHPLAKKHATHEVPSNDANGIATLIDHYLLRRHKKPTSTAL